MKRWITVLGLVAAMAIPVAAAAEEEKKTGLDNACEHETVAAKNPNCPDSTGPGGGSGGGNNGGGNNGGGGPANEPGPNIAARAAGCADDREGDGNMAPDGCDTGDTDEDGIPNQVDNCPGTANNGQWDADDDGLGDACDPYPHDSDHDGKPDSGDNCKSKANADQTDSDGDDIGDACDSDANGDDVPDTAEGPYREVRGAATATASELLSELDSALP